MAPERCHATLDVGEGAQHRFRVVIELQFAGSRLQAIELDARKLGIELRAHCGHEVSVPEGQQ